MTNDRRQAVRRVFMEVADLSGDERDAAIANACGDDATLRAEVEALLRAESEAGGFMKDPTNQVAGSDDANATVVNAPSEQPGQTIGHYKLLQQIGEGGFGVVYMAEQEKPVRRRVALKIIKLGMDTKQVIARFEAERQALAMMDHPNIAKVLDAGATETGRPYFVMELVKGEAITEYCDRHNVSVEDRLALFQQTCNAVQHAHQKGIIHRDIKPSNVMITLHDGKPIPKVIDFGIAKATDHKLTEKTVFTEFRQFIGTPEYMSPEQAEMTGVDVDTRSDVYSLGVLLYELLTGTTPFDSQKLRSAAYGEIQRIIREETPHKPSTRLSTMDTLPSVAAQRHIEPRKLGLLIRGDLDWIVMKALEKDRTRRYETANGFAADIQRYLDSEPVTASPPSAGYKLRKFIRRNKAGVIAASLIASVLVVGVAGTTMGMVWALHEKDRADTEATNATLAAEGEKEAKLEAIDEAQRAERELARATEIKRFLVDMLDGLGPDAVNAADLAFFNRVLHDAGVRLASGEIADEQTAVEMHGIVGVIYLGLGLYEEAERHLSLGAGIASRVLGDEHEATLGSAIGLATLHDALGQAAEAEQLLAETLQVARRVLGDQHDFTLAAMGQLGGVHLQSGRYTDAEPLLDEALRLSRRVHGVEDPRTVPFMQSLAQLYAKQTRSAEAERLCVDAVEITRRAFGEAHPSTLSAEGELAGLRFRLGQFAEAERMYVQLLEKSKRAWGDEHPATLAHETSLAVLLVGLGRYAEAEPMLERILEQRERDFGAEHPTTLDCMSTLAYLHLSQNRLDQAESQYLEAHGVAGRVFGEGHPVRAEISLGLARLYVRQRRYTEAEPLLLERLEIERRTRGGDLMPAANIMAELGTIYWRDGRYAEAESMYVQALHVHRTMDEGHPNKLAFTSNLAGLYLSMQRYEDAAALLEPTLSAMRRVLGAQHSNTRVTINNLANAYRALGRTDDLRPLARELQDYKISLVAVPDPDPSVLALVARDLLTNEFEELRDPERALTFAKRSCALQEAVGGGVWLSRFLDTLALAQHMTGDTAAAIESLKRAIELAPEVEREELNATLAKYEAALESERASSSEGDDR